MLGGGCVIAQALVAGTAIGTPVGVGVDGVVVISSLVVVLVVTGVETDVVKGTTVFVVGCVVANVVGNGVAIAVVFTSGDKDEGDLQPSAAKTSVTNIGNKILMVFIVAPVNGRSLKH